jgi:hypothetical protein
MPSASYINKVKSYSIFLSDVKLKYIEEGVVVPNKLGRELLLFSVLEQCLYISDSFAPAKLDKLNKVIEDAIKQAHGTDVPIYTFNSNLYMKYTVTPPADRIDMFNKILERVMNSGINILDDCSKDCDDDNRIAVMLYHTFIAAMSANDIGKPAVANLLYEHINYKLHISE